jgi:hypothetical protein
MANALATRPIIGVITNPNSKKNRRKHDRVRELQDIVGDYGVVRQTPSTAAIPNVIGEFLDLGVDFWVSDGGDGALYWMLNTAHDVIEERSKDGKNFAEHLRYALPTNGGTIDYVARKAGVRGRAEDILKKLVDVYEKGEALEESIVPSLHFECVQVQPDGSEVIVEKVGFATAVAGVGNRFFEKYYLARVPGPKVIVEVVAKASLSHLVGMTPFGRLLPPSWLQYGRDVLAPMPASVTVDGRELPMKQFTTIAVGAFKINLGNVFKLFTHAGDGVFHVMAGEPSPLEIMSNFPRMLTGRNLQASDLFDAGGREVVVRATGPLLRPNIDGEFVDDVKELRIVPGPKFRIPQIDAKSQ